MPARPTKEELVKDFRTSEILEAARRVIAERGVEEASVERIAHEAGVAKGTIYLYFDNKEMLLARTAEHGFRELMTQSRDATRRAHGAVPKLEALVREMLEHSAEHQAFFQALQRRTRLGDSQESMLAHEVGEQAESYASFVSSVIDEGIAAGEFRKLDSQRAARFLVEMIRGGIVARFRTPSPASVDRDARSIVDFFVHGAAAQETGS